VSAPARLRAFLIDDEPLALSRLARMLDKTGRVEIVGRATDPAQGLEQVRAHAVDVLFLDIHMPGLSGFEVVQRVPPGPAVVFTTAFDRHAMRAFEVNAVDYLLKPVEAARLDQALDRAAARRGDAGGDLHRCWSAWRATSAAAASSITWPRASAIGCSWCRWGR
jgi:two-component system LytT family response regulator